MTNKTYRETCFANKDGECIALTVGKCIGADMCSFYKSRPQLARELVQVDRQLAAMPWEKQEYIADTYYGGRMPWLKGAVV